MTRPRALPLALTSAVSAAAIGCGSSATTSTSLTGPSNVRCQPAITSSATAFGPGGGSGTLSVGVARECSWTAASQASWIVITSGASGQGDGTIAFTVAENLVPTPRQAALNVGEQRVDLSQQAAPCRFDVAGAFGTVPATGGEVGLSVSTHAVCDWTTASHAAWVSVVPGTGRGAANVRVLVTPNPGPERNVEVTIAGHRLSGTQGGTAVPSPSPSPSPNPAPPSPGPSPTPSPSPPAPPPSPPAPGPAPPAPDPAPPMPGPVPVRKVELSGKVQALAGSCPDLSFHLRAASIYTTSATKFDDVSCGSMRNGLDVEVEGMLMSDGRVRADKIDDD